jgi:bifunctional non-homologous end joining protein LigD
VKKSLEAYRRKRNFDDSTEPSGKANSERSESLIFVVQKHSATRLHYDLRLEMDGVLKSWAVPKGPALDPKVKRLAIHVEDHPLEYARFEGVIPAGNYGAGNMIVWDIGTWHPLEATGTGYGKGHLKFELKGEKLQGKWALVRMNRAANESQDQWLLIKERDEFAVPEATLVITDRFPLSVLTGRDVFQLRAPHSPTKTASARGRHSIPGSRLDPSRLGGSKKTKMPKSLQPQLASPTSRVPEGSNWLHEIKYDGYRLIAVKDKSTVTLWTRNQYDWSARFPSLVASLEKLNVESFMLDGEIALVKADGVTDFGGLQSSLKTGKESQLTYYAFDLPYFHGYDLRSCKLIERKELLKSVIESSAASRLQFSDHVLGKGAEFFKKCRDSGVEGVISKRVDSKYKAGRSETWLKCKSILSDDFVIGGYVRSDSRPGAIGSLVVGFFSQGHFVFAGKVGSGFSERALTDLKRDCDSLSRKESPFHSQPTELRKDRIVWIEPSIVVRVNYIGWTSSQQLRHAVFIGMRQDIDSAQIREPQRSSTNLSPSKAPPAKTVKLSAVSSKNLAALAKVNLTNPQKILFPSEQLTKLDVAKFYIGVTDRMLAYHQGRPVSLVRCPEGIEQPSFFQKHPSEGTHPSIGRVLDPDSLSQKLLLEVSNVSALGSAVQLGTIEFHPWSARSDRLDRPDRIIFDFDPDTRIGWTAVKEAAMACQELLRSFGLKSFVKTSGGKGIHVIVPIQRRPTWQDVQTFAKALANRMVRDAKTRYTSNMSKDARRGKILIDVHRNHRGSTCVGAYSARARTGATVSMPLRWRDLKTVDDSREFDMISVLERIRRGTDPWKDFYTIRQSISKTTIDKLKEKSR